MACLVEAHARTREQDFFLSAGLLYLLVIPACLILLTKGFDGRKEEVVAVDTSILSA